MFVKVSKEELVRDLQADLTRLATETERNSQMKIVFDGQKD